VNPQPYDDQTYGEPLRHDAQQGRMSGHMRAEPVFLRPTTAEFWILVLVTFGASLLLLTLWGLLAGPDPLRLWLGAAVIMLLVLPATYLADGLLRWRRVNRNYPGRPGAQWKPRP
jgi:hypothetical protein